MDVSLTGPAQKIKHPKEMYRISFVLLWERFAYYGIITLLIAFVVTQLHFKQTAGYAILGAFAALSYGMPLFGGVISDSILGKRKSLIWGCVLHFIGLVCIALPYHNTFFIGLSCYVTGSAFFGGITKALLGDFYHPDDTRGKDAGFTIYYGLFNVGVGLGAIVCGYIGQQVNWRLGFAAAAVGAFLSLVTMLFGIHKKHGPAPVRSDETKSNMLPGLNREILVYLLTIPVVALITFLFFHPGVMGSMLFPLALVSVVYVIYRSYGFSKAERLKIFAALLAFTVWALFLALYEQSSGSFNLFVLHNLNTHVGSINLPGLAINNSLPGFLPALMTPLMIYAWRRLGRAGREPGTILKFIIGFLFLAAFFGLFWWGCELYSSIGLVPIYFLFGGYILMEFSEMCIGPVVYSLTYKLSPKTIAGTMMGVLGIAAATGEFLASKIGSLTSVPSNITNPVKTLPYFSKIYGELAVLSVGIAVLFVLLLPVFKRWMQDVR